MAIVEVVPSLIAEIEATFKGQGVELFEYLKTLEQSPKKGKLLGSVKGIVIKELKYNGFRFYFVTDGLKLRCYDSNELVDLLLKFVRMSDKKDQQQVINEIKRILILIGPDGFK